MSENKFGFKNFSKIGSIYGCSSCAVRYSVITIRNKLVRLKEGFEIINQVVNECEQYDKE